MAIALQGTHPQGTPRVRILLCICELQQVGAPATYREIQRKLGMSSGSMTHHLSALEHDGMISRIEETRAFTLTHRALSELLRDEWLVPSHAISVVLSTKALEFLELAPSPDEASDVLEEVPDPSVEPPASQPGAQP